MRTATGTAAHELVPLADRLRFMQLFRLAVAAVVLAFTVLAPEAQALGRANLFASTAAYVAFSLLGHAVWRAWGGRGLTLFGATLIVDGVYLAWVSYATGGTVSVLRYLILLHLIAVALLASYRTGLKLALWHSLLLFIVFQAQESGVIQPLDPALSASGAGFQERWAFIIVFWLVAMGTASFSAVNERELRRRKFDLEALARMAADLEDATSPQAVATTVVDGIVDTFGFGRAALLEAGGDRVRILAGRGCAGTEDGSRWLPVDGVIADAWTERQTLLVSRLDLDAAPVLAALMPAADNLIAVPLLAEGRPIGALVAEHGLKRGSRIERRVVSTVERFASHGALALRNAVLLEEMHRLATIDELTGVGNRRTFEATLEREVSRVVRGGGHVGLVLVDIDHFKRLNDTHGHQVGDQVLHAVATTLASQCRNFDSVARYGGEEFAVLLPGSGGPEAMAAAERLRQAVEQAQTVVPVTVSAGVSVYPAHCSDAASLVKAADEALYRSKGAGRNRVTSASARRSRSVRAGSGAAPAGKG
jgi:two-component system cell cycle response regulator